MRLISLTLHGFKSFPERTVIRFNEGVTAIVGPNGSGKSNITDAIRWVMGEQSVRTLRGDKMEDVIFSGTNNRKAMSMAEVTILIDNSDGGLGVDFAEVAVTRRLYRSGESEFFINQRGCRLKDIHALFMDTGLGRDSYSIIGQGRVEEILSPRSEDRRKIFEEAAGIQKYKVRHQEACRKLEATDQNLLRVKDILVEIEKTYPSLESQSKMAATYLTLYDELQTIDIALLLKQIEADAKAKEQTAEDRAQLEAELALKQQGQEQLQQDLLDSQTQLASGSELLKSSRQHLQALQQQLTEQQQEEARLKERMVLLQQRFAEQGASAEDLEEELQNLVRQKESCLRQFAAVEAEYQTIAAQRQAEIEQLQQLKARQTELYAEISRLSQTEASLKQQTEQLQQNRRERSGAQQQMLLQQESLQGEQSRLEQQLTEADQLRSRQLSLLSGLEEKSRQQQQQQDALKQNLKDCQSHLQSIKEQRDLCLATMRQQTFKVDTLRNLEANLTGYNETVRQILRRGRQIPGLSSQIRGTLSSLLETEPAYDLAIETALGASMQNIVVQTEAAASDLISILKNERLGRATFLPVNSITARNLSPQEQQRLKPYTSKGVVGVAADLVRSTADIKPIVQNLLGRIIIVDTLPHAIDIARALGHSLRLVTLEGDVMNPGGSMTGGYHRGKSSGLLSRSRDIKQLEAQLNGLHQQQNTLDGKLSQADAEVKQVQADLDKLQGGYALLQQQQAAEQARLQAIETQCEELNQRKRQKSDQAGQLALSLGQLDLAEQADINQDQTLQQKLIDIKAKLDQADTALRQHNEKQLNCRDQVALMESRFSRMEERFRSQKNEVTRLEQEYNKQKNQLAQACQQQQHMELSVANLQENLENLAQIIRQRQAEQEEAKAGLQQAELRQQELQAQRDQLYVQQNQLSDDAAGLANQLQAIQHEAERLAQRLDLNRNRLWEDYELTSGLVSLWPAAAGDDNILRSRLTKLRAELKKLGPVNLQAIDDYQQLCRRRAFMQQQYEDIQSARSALNQVIEQLLEAMRTQFTQKLEQIRGYFQESFTELFGGGQADIVPEDGKDILEGGIDIRVSPPGKRLQNMLLLSGGERTLAAIALLFAILKLRPTPFYVLDEIEAALDESNVFRFTAYIKKYREQSQFILVTHRKGTMEAAETIYGVAMQERGVSKILSLQMQE
ncbi:chromosome segregation protein SMC [Oscillospiraceae bacterium HV4-5-C5C]|nr:chromosome segregation protein SMC [Oscillospiraceae bacterium HV4-5-C5C]